MIIPVALQNLRMIEMKKILAFFVIAVSITSVLNIEIECDYRSSEGFYIKRNSKAYKYCCYISSSSITQLEDKDVLTVTGAHQDGYSNNDVEALDFYGQEDTTFLATFPKLAEVFPNFRYLLINIAYLNGFSNQDLKHFPDLEYIVILGCQINSLPSSLFQYNRKLKLIRIAFNEELDHVGRDIFKNLTNLQSVSFEGNKCLNEYIKCDGRHEIDELNLRLSFSSCSSKTLKQIDNDLRKFYSSSSSRARDFTIFNTLFTAVLVLVILSKLQMK